MRKYKIFIKGQTEGQDIDFNFHTNIPLKLHDAIVMNDRTFFLHEQINDNEFSGIEIGAVVSAFE